MRRQMRLLVGVFLLTTACCVVSADLAIQKLDREITIKNNMVAVQDAIEVKNTGSSASKQVILCASAKLTANAALLEVVVLGDSKELEATPIKVPTAPDTVACFSYELATPLKAGQTSTLKSYAVYTHVLRPFPASITQRESQLVVLEDYLYAVSPYTIPKQTIKVTLTSSTVPSYTKVEPVSKSGDKVTYGPYKDVKPFTLEPLRLHFENNQPFIEVVKLVREFEISHWGNVYVEEQYELKQGGAQHKGQWSRLDYQSNPGTFGKSAIQALQAELPGGARWLYYKDVIGNISTSHVRTTRQKVDVILEPRFPLFGGWKTEFTFGYSVPLPRVVSKIKGGKLQFKAPYSTPFKDCIIDELIVRVVLPEGSANIQPEAPFSNTKVSSDVKYTYLDIGGRPVVQFEDRNIVPLHQGPFTVTYTFSFFAMLREPLLLIAAFAVLFGTIIVCMRLEFTISHDEKWRAARDKEKVVDLLEQLEGVITVRRGAIKELHDAAANKSVEECQAVKTHVEATFKETESKLKVLLKTCDDLGGGIPGQVKELLEKERALKESALAVFVKKVQMIREGAKPQEIEKKLGAQEKAVIDAGKEVKQRMEALLE